MHSLRFLLDIIARLVVLMCLLMIHQIGFAEVLELHKDCSTLSTPRHYPDYEPLSAYSIEHRDYTATKPAVLVLQIATSPDAFNSISMVRLLCKLAADFSNEYAVEGLVFDDKKAAHELAIGATDQRNYDIYLWHFRGRFELSHDKRRCFVEFVLPEVQEALLSTRRIKVSLSDPSVH
jgi:hypothetical protein